MNQAQGVAGNADLSKWWKLTWRAARMMRMLQARRAAHLDVLLRQLATMPSLVHYSLPVPQEDLRLVPSPPRCCCRLAEAPVLGQLLSWLLETLDCS